MGIVTEKSQAWLDRRSYPFEPNFMAVDGGNMHYIDTRGSNPVLFLHGWPTWSFEFRTVIRLLARDVRCIAPDFLGFGLSTKPADWSYTPAAHARSIGRLIEELDLRDLTIVGRGLGGPIGACCALDHPERVRSLVLMNTWLWDLAQDPVALKPSKLAQSALGPMSFLTLDAAPKMIKGMFCNKDRYTESVNDAYFGPFHQKQDRYGAFITAQMIEAESAWFDELWRLRQDLVEKELTLVWGTHDGALGEHALNKLWHEFPLCRVVQLPDSGAMLAEEHPESVAEAIRDSLHVRSGSAFLA